jgi:hypothetical protein
MNNTRDLADFGMREMKQAQKLLRAYVNADVTQLFNERFSHEGVTLELNPRSGYVFLTNDELQVGMLNYEAAGYEEPLLDLWLFSPHDGVEGFVEDLVELYLENDLTGDDQAYLFDVLGDVEGYRKRKMNVEGVV